MNLSHIFKTGWGQGFFVVLVLWGLNNTLDSYSAQVLNVNSIIYSSAAFTSCALALLLVAGWGPLAKETMRSVDTWAFGFILLINYAVSLNLFSMVTATEGSLILRFSLIVSILSSWFFLSRIPSKWQLVGLAIVMLGILVICNGIEAENKADVYGLMIISGILQAARVFLAELHRPHVEAAKKNDLLSQCRVVGFIMFAVSALFLFTVFLLALIAGVDATKPIINGLPVFKDFFHTPSILVGMLAGIIFIAPIRFLEFSSIEKIKTENFLAIASLSFFATWFWEWFASPFTGINLETLTHKDIIAGIVITLGGILITINKLIKANKKTNLWKDYLSYSSQDLERVDDSREIVANTLEHFSGNVRKCADTLNVSVGTIEALLLDKEKVLAFKPDILKKVARKYRHSVATSDALTGLANRAGFMTALKSAAYEVDEFSVVYIDLDKFKPINDTYGHDAGDYVLKGIGERLQKEFSKNAVTTRLGGDEFCVLLLAVSKDDAEKKIKDIQNLIAEPFKFEGNTLNVTASVGVSCYPECSRDAEELLKIADGNMYTDKRR